MNTSWPATWSLCVLLAISCGIGTPAAGGATAMDANGSAVRAVCPTALPLPSVGSGPPSPVPKSISGRAPTGNLRCVPYIELAWGAGVGELGLCPPTSTANWRGPYPLTVDEGGDLYVLDKVNRRVAKYGQDGVPTAFSIPPQYLPADPCAYGGYPPSNISARGGRLFFVSTVPRKERDVDEIVVLPLYGQEEHAIDLEAYYPLHNHAFKAVVADGNGGVYLLLDPVAIVYYDADRRPKFNYLGQGDPTIFQNFVVGWDRNVYSYFMGSDLLVNWGRSGNRSVLDEAVSKIQHAIGLSGIVSASSTSLMGVDVDGRIYLSTFEPDEGWLLVRLNPKQFETVNVALPEETVLVLDALAPDGSLYGLQYDYRDPDPSVGPKIIRCTIEQN